MADSDKNDLWLPDGVSEDDVTEWDGTIHCKPDGWYAVALPSWVTVNDGVSSVPARIVTATSVRGFELSRELDTSAPCFTPKLGKVTSLLKEATTKGLSYAPGTAAATAGALADACAGLSASVRDLGTEDVMWAIDGDVDTETWFDFTSLAMYAGGRSNRFKAAFFATFPGLHSEEALMGPELGVLLETVLTQLPAGARTGSHELSHAALAQQDHNPLAGVALA